MRLFDFFKQEEPGETIDYQGELAKIIAVYAKYPVFPYIPYEEEGIEEWIESMIERPDLLIPEEVMTPNEEGLLLGEIKLLEWVSGCSSQIKEFPVYFERQYGIDPLAKTDELLFADYLDIDTNITSLNYWTLEELNEVLKEHHLVTAKTITEAISEISREFSAEFIEDLIYPGRYILMAKGRSVLEKYA